MPLLVTDPLDAFITYPRERQPPLDGTDELSKSGVKALYSP